MESKEFLRILKNIYGTLTYEDWVHAKEYVKLQIDRIENMQKKKIKGERINFNLNQKQKE